MNMKFSLLFCFIFPICLYGQQVNISATPDRNEIKIGEQIHYKISVETDSTARVSFPDANQFAPFEVVTEAPIDTFKEREKFRLIKEYALTQFDSGHYTLPPLHIDINKQVYQTDSLHFIVQNVAVDTLKQPLYDIKPAIEIKKGKKASLFWYWLMGVVVISGIIFSIYWFFLRKRRKEEKDEIALLPPFDRALLKLKNLKDSRYLIESNHKEYYSVLTDIVRKYLEEEIHISATESTTDELLTKLQVFLDAGKLHLSSDVINELRTVLHKADLVKFAKSQPEDFEAEKDRESIETIVVKTNEGLPDTPQEEDLQDIYQKQLSEDQRNKRRKRYLLIASVASVLLLVLIACTWYAFTVGKDKEISMENWYTSSYGYPAITITTPQVLKREKSTNQADKFVYINPKDELSIMLISNSLKDYIKELAIERAQQETQADEQEKSQSENSLEEMVLKMIEVELEKHFNGENILIKEEPYTATQGVAGHKVFGSFTEKKAQKTRKMRYQSFFFITGENLQMILFTYPEDEKALGASLVEKIMTTVGIQ